MAGLLVEGEVEDVDGAGGAEDGHRDPHHVACRVDYGQGVALLLQARVRTVLV